MAFGSGHSFGALGDDDLLDAPAGADEALDRAADLVRLVDAIHAARGTAAAESSHAQLLHALAAITDASIIRTARVDVSFPVSGLGHADDWKSRPLLQPADCTACLAIPRRVSRARL